MKLLTRPPLPPKFNVEQGHAGKRAEMGVFFAPPERPKPYLVNIELGQRGREVYIWRCSGWAFFSHTPVTNFCDISVPRGVVGCGPSVAPQGRLNGGACMDSFKLKYLH